MNTRAYGTKNLPFIQAEIILIALAAPYGLFLSLWVIVRKRLQKKQPHDTAVQRIEKGVNLEKRALLHAEETSRN